MKSDEGEREQEEWGSSSESEADSDDDTSRIGESGGQDKCAYFFWQGRAIALSLWGKTLHWVVKHTHVQLNEGRVIQVCQNSIQRNCTNIHLGPCPQTEK